MSGCRNGPARCACHSRPGGSNGKCEQFNRSNTEHQHCKGYRLVVEPKTHDSPRVRPGYSIARSSQSALGKGSSLRLRARYRHLTRLTLAPGLAVNNLPPHPITHRPQPCDVVQPQDACTRLAIRYNVFGFFRIVLNSHNEATRRGALGLSETGPG